MARPRQVSDAEILRTARVVFLEHGPSVSTQVIATGVGLSQPALFKRFGTKSELLLRALTPSAIPGWIHRTEAGIVPGKDARTQLRVILEEMNAFYVEYAPCWVTLRASTVDFEAFLERARESAADCGPIVGPLRGQRALTGWLMSAVQIGAVRPMDSRSVAMAILVLSRGKSYLPTWWVLRLRTPT